MNANPDFSKFQIASVAARKRWSNGFLALCAATSAVSIIILVILITTIIVSALPVFGPHADTLVSESRMLFVQGESGDNEQLDDGDFLQGVFQASQFQRGGLGRENDDVYIDEGGVAIQTTIGLFSFQIEGPLSDNIQRLVPATGKGSLQALLSKLDIELPADIEQPSIVVLTSPTVGLDIEALEVEGALNSDKLVQQLKEIDDWSLDLAIGQSGSSDFAEIVFTDANNGQLDAIRKTRVRKSAGKLKILSSMLYDRHRAKSDYKNVKLRSSATSEIATSQIKIDDVMMDGISRRKRNGFDLRGKWNLESKVVPEDDASTGKHFAHFMSAKPSDSNASEAGIGPALWGSIWVCTGCALFALPLGIGTAVFLEEFKPGNRFALFLQNLIQLNITNLAGVPSIVYGILGLTAFGTMFGIFGSDTEPEYQIGADHYFQYLTEANEPILIPVDSPKAVPTLQNGIEATDGDYNPIELNVIGPDDALPDDQAELKWTIRNDSQGGLVSDKPWYYFQLPFGRGVLAASLTLMLVILPVIIIASQESIKAVPSTLRQAAMGLGSTRWQVVRNVTLPAAIPGIMTGAILSISRAIGEAAPVIVLCGTVFIASSPQHLMDFYSVLPIQIFHITGLPTSEDSEISFQNVAAAASLILLAVLLTFNTIAIVLRQLTSKPLS